MKEQMPRGDLYISVVTRDVPSGVVALGVPARVHRGIGEQDRIDISVH